MTFWVAGAVVVGGVASSMIGANAAGDAADTQAAAADRSTALQKQMFDQQRTDNLPFMQTGYKANDALTNLLQSGAYSADPTFAQYQQDPSYAWQQREGAKAVQGSAAARGGLYSGATMRALQDRAQSIASTDYGNWWNRQQQGLTNRTNLLSAIRSGGQAATSQVGQAGQNYATNAGSNMMGAANAQGAAGIGSANSWGNALNGGVSAFKNAFASNPYSNMGLNGNDLTGYTYANPASVGPQLPY